MITITFPDGAKKEFPVGITPFDIAKSIGRSLGEKALAANVNGRTVDLSFKIEENSTVQILTFDDPLGKEVFRHSTAHLLAHAIQELYPNAKNTIGPAVEEGFYYDFDNLSLTPSDFPAIEKKMAEIVSRNLATRREVWTLAQVKKHLGKNQYKQELAEEFQRKGSELTVYWQGDSFVDLCEGPHVPFTGMIKAFKLTKLAGAYWKGDSKNQQLTRVYGISFPSSAELAKYFTLQEEISKRDHRKIGKEQDLFLFSELVGPGLPLWTPKGTILRMQLDNFIWKLRSERGYQQVTIPHLTKKELYMTSGHWKKFSNDLFKINTRDGHEFAMKPMNCPHHTQIFAHLPRSYRDMPQRYAETTMVYRDEQTGELGGLSRVLCITQDDAHVFCRESQVKEEAFKIWDIVNIFYGTFGFQLKARLSLHDPTQFDKYVGTKEIWTRAENQLREFLSERKVNATEAIGEAAFYGPKIDFIASDSLGRQWQVATIQIDRSMPESFDLSCTNEQNNKERIVMLHAAIMGSIERFLSVLIEHVAGKFPLWLNPVQVKIVTINDNVVPYAKEVMQRLSRANLRVELDDRALTLGKKIREAQLEQVNYILVIGEEEMASKTVNVRTRDNKVEGTNQILEFMQKAVQEVAEKR